MLLSACTSAAAPELVHVTAPAQLLDCKTAPEKPAKNATQKEYAVWAAELWFAHRDCSEKLRAVKKFSSSSAPQE